MDENKIIKLRKPMDIIKTNERITRLVMSGELDSKQAKVLYQGVNSAIKALELLHYDMEGEQLKDTVEQLQSQLEGEFYE